MCEPSCRLVGASSGGVGRSPLLGFARVQPQRHLPPRLLGLNGRIESVVSLFSFLGEEEEGATGATRRRRKRRGAGGRMLCRGEF